MAGRLLVAYSNSSNYVSTIAEYLRSIRKFSSWDVSYLHVTHGANFHFDFNEFDAIFNSYCARLPFEGYVSAEYLKRLKAFRGVKMLSVQDEYDRTGDLRNAISEFGFHLVLTCVPASAVERVYPRAMFPQTEFVNVLTGYVPDHLADRGKAARPLKERPIHIGYRGREGVRYGRLGFLKFEIGRRMREICEARGIPHDIEWTEEKRIYGEKWYDFIASCRANLGSEGGSNVFDLDGAIDEAYRRLTDQHDGAVPYEVFREYTDPFDAQFDCGQITPRIFEAAALRTPLVLFPGRYSGLIEPDEHFIELKEDFSNVDEVLARLADLEGLGAMAERAHAQLIGSGNFGYSCLVELVDRLLTAKAAELGLALRPPYDAPAADAATDLAELASFCEQPTSTPRHPVFFGYKELAQENASLKEEINDLNVTYPAEIARLNDVYSAEIRRITTSYEAEVAGLRAAIEIRDRLHTVPGLFKAGLQKFARQRTHR